MDFVFIIAILVVGFILWNSLGFIRYKKKESKDKTNVAGLIASGVALPEAIERVFVELNVSLPNKLAADTVSLVAMHISSLQEKMDTENIIEIYSTFVYRYVCRNSTRPHPNVTDNNVLYAVRNMTFDERNGYFVLKVDDESEIDKKYPKLAP